MNLELARALGRNGDTELAHITPEEGLILKALGGSGTINPNTGLREYYYSSDPGGEDDTDWSDAGDNWGNWSDDPGDFDPSKTTVYDKDLSFLDYKPSGLGERFKSFFGFKPGFEVKNGKLGDQTTQFDVRDAPAIGAALSMVNPALGAIYGLQRGFYRDDPMSGALAGLSGLTQATSPLSMGAAALAGLNDMNQMSDMMGRGNIDDISFSGLSGVLGEDPEYDEDDSVASALLNAGYQS